MLLYKNLPTVFATHIAAGVDLYLLDSHEDPDLYEELRDRLVTFQQMALCNEFEVCLTAYLGYNFENNPQRLEALKTIYQTTKPWLMGHVLGTMLEKLDRSDCKNPEEVAQLLINNFANDKKSDEETKRGLLVRFTDALPEAAVSDDEEEDAA